MAYGPAPCDMKCHSEHQILFLLSGEETNEIINLKYLVFQDDSQQTEIVHSLGTQV